MQRHTNRQLRILYLIDILAGNQGGTERQLIELIKGLDRERFKSYLICLSDSPWFQTNARIFDCDSSVWKIDKLKNMSTYINFGGLIKFMKDFKPDIVHTFFPVGNSLGVIAARLSGIKQIVSSRRDYGEWMNDRYLFATKLANTFTTRIIANSQAVRELTERAEKVRNGKVEVIYNGIDLNKFNKCKRDDTLKKKLNIPDNDKVVGIVANFRPMKHHFTFIQAAHEILQTRQDISFLLVGGTPETVPLMEKMKALGKSFNISEKLCFTGSHEDIMPYLSIMDIGVNCSEKEGLSNAIMEYMAGGIPCIVSNAGGNPDLITNNVNGYTFELDDYRTLAERVLKLLDDDVTKQIFIERSRDKIEKEMSLEAMLLQYENLYQRLFRNN